MHPDTTTKLLPRDMRSLGLELPLHLRLGLAAALPLAHHTRIFRRPIEIDPENYDLITGLYSVYRSVYSIERAKRGSGLEDYFARQPREATLPADFECAGTVRLSAAGDLMRNPLTARSRDRFLRSVADLVFDAELSLANFEAVVTRSKEVPPVHWKYPGGWPKCLASADDALAMLSHGDRHFTHVSLANNHSLDEGVDGHARTVELLERAGIGHFGTSLDPSGRGRAVVVDRGPLRIGMVGATYGFNGNQLPEALPHLVHCVAFHDPRRAPDLTSVEREIEECRAQGAHFVVVSLHWGMEYELYPRPGQVTVAHRLAESGADLILGHHPHCIQPFEVYRTRDERSVPIFYSLGNLSAEEASPHASLSLVVRLRISRGTVGGRSVARAHDLEVVPVYQREVAGDARSGPHVVAERLDDHGLGPGVHTGDHVATMRRYASIALGRS